ncbi:MAG TPA: hypothetical protein VF010_05205 [Methylomirabilota bacterium]|nr:hypothetical protein [Methylomirabilota bacterium]
MSRRRVLSGLLVVVACVSLALFTASELRIFWRALVLSWDRPATQGLDELGVQALLDGDPQGDVQKAALPVDASPRRHRPDTALTRLGIACRGDLSRSPPSA